MTKQEKITTQPSGLDLMRVPFEPHQISKLPKPTKRQTDEVRADFQKGIRCTVCGGWHHPKVVHLDYVGHAALTDRLLDCDPAWNWEPLSFTEQGTPALDANGGMWIRLTVCGVTRYGYGHPDGKKGGDAIKEVIGDALRNAAMRFGAALDLWHKGALHDDAGKDDAPKSDDTPEFQPRGAADRIITGLRASRTIDDLARVWTAEKVTIAEIKAADAKIYAEVEREKNEIKATIAAKASKSDDLGGDQIPF